MKSIHGQRRKFLKRAASGAIATGALMSPMVSRAETVSLQFQSTWPANDIFHEYALDFASKVNNMSGGRLKIIVLPSEGAAITGFQLPATSIAGLMAAAHMSTAREHHAGLAALLGVEAAQFGWPWVYRRAACSSAPQGIFRNVRTGCPCFGASAAVTQGMDES
jgi:TRAP-type mannitol/chloroaromatic compound transport system substrate-binding protein